MPKPKLNPEYLFKYATQPKYWDTPQGCLRLVRIEREYLIGDRFSRSYRVLLRDCKPSPSKGLWAVSKSQVQDS